MFGTYPFPGNIIENNTIEFIGQRLDLQRSRLVRQSARSSSSQMPTVTLRLCLSTVIAHAARD